jgi:hypothetical protein
MISDGGPLDTYDYRLTMEAIPLGERQVFTRVSFSFRYRFMTRMLSATYYAFARSRPGFTVERITPEGEPVLVTGRVAAIERNVMRFYLALQAQIEGLSQPEGERFEWRLRRWYALTQKYPRQLYDVEESAYLEAKRRERAQSGQMGADPSR